MPIYLYVALISVLIGAVLVWIFTKIPQEDHAAIVIEYKLDAKNNYTFYDWLDDGREFEYKYLKGTYYVYFDKILVGTVEIGDKETFIPIEEGLDLIVFQ